MAEERDYNDVIDDIVFTDDAAIKTSYLEGYDVGLAKGTLEGYHMGYHRGAEIGRELGYYFCTIKQHIELSDKNKYSEKIVRQLSKVKELIEAFPTTSTGDQDLLGMLETIRAQYKKACALLKIPVGHPYDTGISF